jgi:hypothetical protein
VHGQGPDDVVGLEPLVLRELVERPGSAAPRPRWPAPRPWPRRPRTPGGRLPGLLGEAPGRAGPPSSGGGGPAPLLLAADHGHDVVGVPWGTTPAKAGVVGGQVLPCGPPWPPDRPSTRPCGRCRSRAATARQKVRIRPVPTGRPRCAAAARTRPAAAAPGSAEAWSVLIPFPSTCPSRARTSSRSSWSLSRAPEGGRGLLGLEAGSRQGRSGPGTSRSSRPPRALGHVHLAQPGHRLGDLAGQGLGDLGGADPRRSRPPGPPTGGRSSGTGSGA